MGKGKKPRLGALIPTDEQVRQGADPDAWKRQRPAWRMSRLKVAGKYGWDQLDAGKLHEIRKFLHGLEGQPWSEVLGQLADGHRRHKDIPVADFPRETQKVLAADCLQQPEFLFRLRLTGRQRIYGVRDGSVIALLWWDPDHDACPVD